MSVEGSAPTGTGRTGSTKVDIQPVASAFVAPLTLCSAGSVGLRVATEHCAADPTCVMVSSLSASRHPASTSGAATTKWVRLLIMIDATAKSPLLEFDSASRAFIEPSEQVAARDVPVACVITFFGDAVHRLRESGRAQLITANAWEDGPHPLFEMEHEGQRLALLHSGVGAPLAGALLEEVIAMGCRAFVVCGGAGVLQPKLAVGHLIVVDSAVRDEGTSHHYLPPGRYIDADAAAVSVLRTTLQDRGVSFLTGRVWTTDAPYRETRAKIAGRRAEGCLAVEMEAAALAAVAAFRHVPLAQVLYGGDDLSGESWDHRSWQSRAEVRDNLIEIAAAAAVRLAELRPSEPHGPGAPAASGSRIPPG